MRRTRGREKATNYVRGRLEKKETNRNRILSPLQCKTSLWLMRVTPSHVMSPAPIVPVIQLARILENFPRESQIRAEVVLAFYSKVRCVQAIRPVDSDTRKMGDTTTHHTAAPLPSGWAGYTKL